MNFTNKDIDTFNEYLLSNAVDKVEEETKIINSSNKQHDKTMDSHLTHSTRFDLSDVVELISLATVEKIKREMELK